MNTHNLATKEQAPALEESEPTEQPVQLVTDGELHLAPTGSGVDDSHSAGSDTEPEPITREQRRSRRKRAVRARTISVKRMTRREIEVVRHEVPEANVRRPVTRAECINGPRPCPFISCKYHLYLDVSPRTGSIKLNFPDLEVWEMSASCALDVAGFGGSTLEDVGTIMNLTRERIRQLEVKGLAKLEALRDMAELREFADVVPKPKRRLPTTE